MKRSLLFLLACILAGSLFAQPLTGTKTIPGDYATIAAAVTALNTNGVGTGGVTFNVAAGHTENTTAVIQIDATVIGTAANPIVFQKNGTGANPLVTRTDAGSSSTSTLGGLGDAVIRLDGTDYITFDGIDLSASNQGIEYGYFTYKPTGTNGCQNVLIQNAVVTMTKGTSAYVIGIYISNGPTTVSSSTGVTVTSAAGINQNITIIGNTVQNVHVGIYARGYSSSTYYNDNIIIGQPGAGNSIHNYGGGSSTSSYGIYFIYTNNATVSNNIINNAAGGGTAHNSTLYGIFLSTGTNANVDIYENTVTVNSGATTSGCYGISNATGGTGTSNTVNIYNNTVQNCTYTTATSGLFSGIINSASALSVNLYGNSVADNSLSGTGTFTGIDGGAPANLNFYSNNVYNNTKNSSGTTYCNRASTAIISYHDNTIYNNTINITGGTSSGSMYGYYNLGSPTSETHFNNLIHDLAVTGTTTSSSSSVYGMHTNTTASDVKNWYNNSIYNLGITTTNGGTVYGISSALGNPANIYSNMIYNLSSLGSSGTVYGIYISSGTLINIYNNFISDLKTTASTNNPAVRGIYISGGTTVGLYYNSIYLDGTSTGPNFGTAAVYASTTPILEMRNNILVNTSVPNGTGVAAAYWRSTSTLTSYAAGSDNNDFYAGAPGPNNLIYYDGTNANQTITGYQALVAPRDAVSFSVLPPFINTSTTPYDLHLQTGIPTKCESGGSTVTSPAIITDYDGDARYPNAGYPNDPGHPATAPDVGADEFAGTPLLPCATPVPGNTLSTANGLCLGQGILLSLQNSTPGAGVTYQWQSSPDGITYSNIAGAIGEIFATTPVESLYYQCVVTCDIGPVSVPSTPLLVSFQNSILTTTPGTRCGIGTVDLLATGSPGTTPGWYDAQIGGTFIGSGSPFTTPVINTTTTYYAGAESLIPGDITVGPGALTSSGYQGPFYYSYGGEKSQYLIRASDLITAGLAAGNLTALAFDITSVGTTFNGFNLSLGTTSQDALTTTFVQGLVNVFSATGLTPTLGNFTITFTTPFAWDGTSNLVVETCWSNNNTGSTPHSHVKYDNSGYVATAYYRADNESAKMVCSSSTGTGTYSSRPKIIFSGYTPCSSPRSAVVATVTPPPALTITGNQDVCNNSVATIEVTSTLADFDTYVWTPATNLFTDAACTIPYVAGASATTVYVKSATAGDVTYTCTGTNTTTQCVNIATTTLSILPGTLTIVSSPPSLCLTGTPTLSATPTTGWGTATFQWQDSPDGITFTDITGATGLTYTPGAPITTTTYFKLLVKLGTTICTESNVVTVTVNNPQITGTIPGSRCGTGTVNLEATGTDGTLSWYTTPTGGASIGSGSPYTTPVINATTTYYVGSENFSSGNVQIGAGALTSSSYNGPFYYLYGGMKSQYLITASELSGAGLVSGNITSLSFEITSEGTTFNDFNLSLGSTSLSALTTTFETGLTTVFSTSGLTPTIGIFTITFNTPFTWDGTSNLLVETCWSNNNGGGTPHSHVKYDATSYVATIYYRADNQTAPVLCAATTRTGSYSSRPMMILTGTTSCSSPRSPVVATITPPPALTITGNQSLCNNSAGMMTVTSTLADFDTYTWAPVTNLFTDAACTTPYVAGASATTVYVKSGTPGSTDYTCTGENTTTMCVNTATTQVTILPPAPTIAADPASICITGSTTLSASPATGWGTATFQWQDSPDGITFTDIPGATAITYVTPTLTVATYYKLIVSLLGIPCTESTILAVMVDNPQITGTTPGSVCGTGTVTLEATTGTGYTLNWYDAPTGGNLLGTGSPFTTPVITATTNFYVSAGSGSASTYTVGPLNPAALGTISSSTLTNHFMIFDVLGGNVTISSVDIFPTASIGSTYNIVIQSSDQTVIFSTGPFVNTVTGGSTPQTVSIGFAIPPGTGYRMGVSSNAGMNRNTTGASYPYEAPGILSITGNTFNTAYYYYFYNWQLATGCTTPRTAVTATYITPPDLTITGNQSLCNNSIGMMTVTSTLADFTNYLWTPVTNLFTDAACTIPYIAGTNASTVYVKSTSAGMTEYTCTGSNSTTQCSNLATSQVMILPAAPMIAVSPEAHCLSGYSVLTTSPSTGYGTATFQWQNSTDGVTFTDIPGATSINYTTPVLTSTTYYKLIISLGATPCTESAIATVQINNPIVTSTFPGIRCGEGTVTLAAFTGAGYTLNWYDALTGGNLLGTGFLFTTPVITTTTTFYVESEAMPGSTATVGDGALTSTGYQGPFYYLYGGEKSQYLIPASELIAAGLTPGNISSLSFDITSDGTTFNNFNLSLGSTSQAFLTTTFVTGLTSVFSTSGLTPTTGIYTITFTTPFAWDGISNLVVETCWSNNNGGSTPHSHVKYDNTSYVATTYYRVDNQPSSVVCPTTTGTGTYSSRPKMILETDPCVSPRSAVIATVIIAPTIAATASPTIICEGGSTILNASSSNDPNYTYTWSPTTTPPTGATVTGYPATTTTYTVVGNDNTGGPNAGCQAFATATVSVLPYPSALTVTPPSAGINPGDIQMLTANGGILPNAPILSENFNTDAPTWTIQNGGSSPSVSNWYYQSVPYSGGCCTFTNFTTQEGGKFAYSNADAGGYGSVTNTKLVSPSFSTMGFTAATLTFEHLYYAFTTDVTVALEISTDGGTTWSVLVDYLALGSQGTVTDGSQATTNASVNLAPYLNQASVKIRFNYSSAWGYYWIVDNVVISGTGTTLTTYGWSPYTSLYTDAAATIPYTGSSITMVYAKPSVTTTFTASATSPALCTTSQNVTVSMLPVPTITGQDNVCAGTRGVIYTTEAGMTNYAWTVSAGGTIVSGGGPSNNSVTVDWMTAGAQLVTVNYTDSYGYQAATPTAKPVTVNPIPDAIAGADRSICLGVNTQIGATAVPGNTYSWTSDPLGFTSATADPVVSPLVSTTYTLVETIPGTGCTNSHNVNVTVNPIPAAVAGADRAICLGDNTQLGATAVPGSTYSWTSVPAGFTSALANPTVHPLVTTTYTLVETITATGCTNSHSITVTVNPLPAAIAGANRAICAGTATQLGAAPVAGNTYSWTSLPPGFSSTLANPTVSPLTTSIYTVIETVTATGCINTNSVFVTVNPLPAAVAGADRTICEGQSTQLGTTAVTGSTYSWTSVPAGFTSTSANPTVSPLVTTTYTVVETKTTTGCSKSNSVIVTVNPLPAAAGAITGSATVTQGQTGVGYTVPAIANATGYTWTLPTGATITSGDNTNSIVVSFSASASSGVMSVYGMNACGNGAASPGFNITVTSAVPTTLTVAETVHVGEIKCFNALQTITVAGGVTTFIVEPGGSATFIAGQNIMFLPGTTVQPGGYMWAYITTTGNYCGTLAPSIVTVGIEEFLLPVSDQTFFKVYPNPTNGRFTLELTGVDEESDVYVEIYTMRGESMQKIKMTGESKREFTLEGNPPGIYVMRILNKDMAGTAKIIKN